MHRHHDLYRRQVLLCHTCLTLACVPDNIVPHRVGSSSCIQAPLPNHRMRVPMRCVGCLPLPGCTCTHTGQYETKIATSTSDRTCGRCDSSQQQFADGENQKVCSPFTFCGVNEKVTAAGSAAKDLACGGCEPGYYQDATKHRTPCLRHSIQAFSATLPFYY